MGKQRAWIAMVLVLMSLVGCTSFRSYRQAQLAQSSGDWDKAVLFYMEALEQDPGNITYKAALLRAKVQASQAHFEKAKKYQQNEVYERALVEYQQAVQLDPSNQSAVVELGKVREQIAAEREQRTLDSSIEAMKTRVRDRNQPPTLNPRSNEPIDLLFPDPVPAKDVYRALGRAFGINIMFDSRLKDQEIAIDLKDVAAQDALEFMMRTANHFYKVLDETSLIIADDTPQNRRNYEDLLIQTFFLSNAEVKDVVTMLRSLIDAKKVASNEQLNAIILRDTADKVKLAERIIEANDKAKAEVVVDVELLQINTNKLLDLGVTWPSQISAGLDVGGADVPLRLSDLEFLNQSNWTLTIPNFVYDFVKTNTNAQLLAKPQLRISEGEQASLVIADRVPVPVTSFNTSNTVGGNVLPITSFQYQDVGITINLEPRVHHNKEVTLKVRVEISNLAGQVETNGQSQPIIGTRTIESTIRLQDGETNFLAGLIRTDESSSENGLPGLSDIPIIGRLFSKNRNQNQRTDVILTLTPHVIRAANITERDLEPIWAGTEAKITFRGGSPRVESDVDGPFDSAPEGSPEEIRELIQRRIQQLPRALRDQANGRDTQPPAEDSGEEAEPPAGIELVPANPPNRTFGAGEEEDPPNGGVSGINLPGARPRGNDPARTPSRPTSGGGGRPPVFGGGNASSALRFTEEPRFLLAADRPLEPKVALRLSPQRMLVAPGDRFQVTLAAAALESVSHLPMTLRFDAEHLAVEKVESGDFLGGSGEAQILADYSRPGEIVLGASRLGRKSGVEGEGVLATITFRARSEGSAAVELQQGQALDSDLEEVGPLSFEPASIEVRELPEKPERPRAKPAKA